MKNFRKNLMHAALTISLTLVLFGSASFVYAQTNPYTVLVPLPGTTSCGDNPTSDQKCTADFTTYLPGLFNLSIGIAAALAFIMISYGGFQYMTTDAVGKKEQGRETITNALWGLLLVIGAYAILYTINPQILNFNLSIAPPNLSNLQSNVDVFTPISGADLADDASTRASLQASGIAIQSAACTGSSTKGCVNLNGLQPNTVAGAEELEQACKDAGGGAGCVTISGGTEGGHAVGSAHNNGTALDIIANQQLNAVITSNYVKGPPAPGSSVTYGNGTYTWEPKGCCGTATAPASTGDHWHVVYH